LHNVSGSSNRWLLMFKCIHTSHYVYTVYQIDFRSDVRKHLSVPFRNVIFRGIIAKERCCFAQLLKVVHSVSDRCFFAPLRKAIRYSLKGTSNDAKCFHFMYLPSNIRWIGMVNNFAHFNDCLSCNPYWQMILWFARKKCKCCAI
jgi:hypothetical protein